MSAGTVSGTPVSVPVQVWVWSLDQPPRAPDEMLSWLSPDEVARADRFKFPHLRSRWVAARAGMRSLLAARIGTEPAALAFGVSEHGKPHLLPPQDDVRFNLSHSEGLAALAVGSVDLGLDIERVAEAHEGVARDHFSADENTVFLGLPPEQRSDGFYRLWTAKEAVLKVLGTGFSVASNSFTIDISERFQPKLIRVEWVEENNLKWQIRAFEAAPGFAGAVAARTTLPIRLTIAGWG